MMDTSVVMDSDPAVRGDDGAYYILRNDVMTGRGELTMFDRTGAIRRKR